MSVDKNLQVIAEVLRTIDKKLIIAIDDIDRLSFEEIVEVLSIVKKSFMFPNTSFILCYDTENLKRLQKENKTNLNLVDFLEKFINLKTSIFISRNSFMNIFKILLIHLKKNLLCGSFNAVGEGIKDILQSDSKSLLKDPRKIKRLINTAILQRRNSCWYR